MCLIQDFNGIHLDYTIKPIDAKNLDIVEINA
jgi:hypothetical protein